MDRIELKIDGMSCGHCVRAVEGALKGVPGVTVEAVAVGSARVSYDAARTTPSSITQAVEDEGYAVVATTT